MNIIKAREELIKGKSIFDMKLRVADYGRVSTDKDEQLNSLSNQVNYFTDMINNVENWTHCGSYIDEGISGTQVKKRDNFLRMIEDARLGKIDMIVTKEVSRFARNTIDSIKYTQKLLSYGVIVYFISDNINTINPDSEFRLTIMASMAQDEVRKLSERVKFGIKRSIKDRKVGGGKLYGYEKLNGKLNILEKEAEGVRLLYSLYNTDKYGLSKIGEIMAERGYLNSRGGTFCEQTLKKMIVNPRYKGYYTANLTSIEDYKTHKKIPNPREEWIVEKDTKGNIPAIVSEEVWNQAYTIFNRRKKQFNRNNLNKQEFLDNSKYTSKIICKEHNSTFIKTSKIHGKTDPVWKCNEYLRHGVKGCETPIIKESELDNIMIDRIEDLIGNKSDYLTSIVNSYITLIESSSSNQKMEKLTQKINENEQLKERLLDFSLRSIISEEEFKTKNSKLNDEIEKTKKEIKLLTVNLNSADYYKEKAKLITEKLEPKLNVKKKLKSFISLFIDKIFVSKIDNDRKHIKLEVVFNFDNNNEELEMFLGKNKKQDEDITSKSKMTKVVTIDEMKKKYLLLTPDESWIRIIRS